MINVDETLEPVFDKFLVEAIMSVKAILTRQETTPAIQREWLTAEQLAERWNLYGKDGEPTTASIYKWAKRGDYPLPHAKMGDLVRFHRDDADRWARKEAERHRKSRNGNGKKTAATTAHE